MDKQLDIQKEIKEAKKRWGFASEEHMLLVVGLMTEVGELANSLRAKYIYHKPEVPEEDKSSLKHELADVAIYLYQIADYCGYNLQDAVMSKIAINDKRFGDKNK